MPIRPELTRFALEQAPEALAAVRRGELRGSAVLLPDMGARGAR